MKRPVLFDGWVLVAALVQLVGYLALATLVPHGSLASVVEPLGGVPTPILATLAVLAIPAVVLAIAFGAALSLVGLEPTTALVPVSAYLVGVATLWAYRREGGGTPESG